MSIRKIYVHNMISDNVYTFYVLTTCMINRNYNENFYAKTYFIKVNYV